MYQSDDGDGDALLKMWRQFRITLAKLCEQLAHVVHLELELTSALAELLQITVQDYPRHMLIPPRPRPGVLTRVLNVVTRALSTAVVKRAGLTRSGGAETGIVTFI